MKSKRNWRLRYWIVAGYAIPIVALIVSATVTVFNTNMVNNRSRNLFYLYKIKSLIDDFDSNVQSNSKSLRGYLLDQDKDSLRNYQKSQSNLKELLLKLSELPDTALKEQSLNRLKDLLSQLSEINSNLISKVDRGKVREAIETWSQSNTRALVEAITDNINELQNQEAEKVTITTKQQQEAVNTLRLVIVLATLISVLLSALFGFWVIRRTAEQMNNSASAIATSTSEIAATIEQQEWAAIQQASSVNQTTTTMDELGVSSRQSAEQAKVSAESGQQILLLVDGRGDEGQSSQSNLQEKVGDIAKKIFDLSE